MNLTINNNTASSQSATACDSYTWLVNGNTYTTSGTYTYTSTNVQGCTDVKTLNLTINNSTASSQSATACDSYTWSVDGNTYTQSGAYTYTSTNAQGCTDVKTLNLTINNSTASNQSATACDSYTWSVNGQTYTTSGTYTYTSTNAQGCTDVKTLNLVITNSTSSSQTIIACTNYTWSVNGQTYTTSGIYNLVNGCDTKTLNLTINPAINISSLPQKVDICRTTKSSANIAVNVMTGVNSTYQWQYSNDNGTSWTTIDSTTAVDVYTTYDTANLTITSNNTLPLADTMYRVLVNGGSCSTATSNVSKLNVIPLLYDTLISGGTTVCAGNNSTTLTLAAGSKGNIQWQYWDPVGYIWVDTGNPTLTAYQDAVNPVNYFTVTNLTASTWYRVKLYNDTCYPIRTNYQQIVVSGAVTVGTINGGGVSVCSGTNSTSLTISGSVGTITWQKSTNYDPSNPSAATWGSASCSTATLLANNLTTTTWYRVVLSSGSCVATTSPTSITVLPAAISKTVTGGGAVCLGSTKVLTLATGSVGSVQWQSSSSSTTNFVDITGASVVATTATNGVITYTTPAITQNTWFRVKLTNGLCSVTTTPPVLVTVNQPATGGTVATVNSSIPVCAGTNSTTLAVTGSTGNIVWQKSINYNTASPTWAAAGSTTNSIVVNTLAATAWYRTLVSSGVCTDTSNVIEVTVNPVAKAGTLSVTDGTGLTLCNSGVKTLGITGYTGSSLQWQSSLDNVTWTNISNNATTYTTPTLTVSTWFRVVVTSGVCTATAATTSIKITVNKAIAGNIAAAVNPVCNGTGTNLTLTGQTGTISWQKSSDNGTTWTAATGATATLATGNLTSTTMFRATLTTSTCIVTTSPITINVKSLVNAGTVSALATNLCATNTGTTLSVTGNDTPATYQWQKATVTYNALTGVWSVGTFANITGATSATYNTGAITATTAYRTGVTNNGCIAYSSSFNVSVLKAGTISGGINNACVGQTTTTLTLTGYQGTNFQWQSSLTSAATGFTNISGANAATYAAPNTYVGTQYYRVVVSNGGSCSVTSAVTSITVINTCKQTPTPASKPTVNEVIPATSTTNVVAEETTTTTKTDVKEETTSSNMSDNPEMEFKVIAYPNPYYTNYNLKVITPSEEKVEVMVYDMAGKLLDKRGDVSPSEISQLKLGDNYPTGVYNVIVIQGSAIKKVTLIRD